MLRLCVAGRFVCVVAISNSSKTADTALRHAVAFFGLAERVRAVSAGTFSDTDALLRNSSHVHYYLSTYGTASSVLFLKRFSLKTLHASYLTNVQPVHTVPCAPGECRGSLTQWSHIVPVPWALRRQVRGPL